MRMDKHERRCRNAEENEQCMMSPNVMLSLLSVPLDTVIIAQNKWFVKKNICCSKFVVTNGTEYSIIKVS